MIVAAVIFMTIFFTNRILMVLEQRKVSDKNYYEINGKKIFFHEAGQGSDLIVLLSGSGIACPFIDMQPIYAPTLQKKSKVLIIDRLGSGLSDDTFESRDIDAVSDELMTVIRKRKQTGRIFLAGHSLAGLFVMRMAQRYPEDISGILLMDSPSILRAANFKDPLPKLLLYMFKYCRILGLLRLYTAAKRLIIGIRGGNSKDEKIEETAMNKNYFSTAMLNERLEINAYGKEILNNQVIPVKSIIVYSNNELSQWETGEYSYFKKLDCYNIETNEHFFHHQNAELIVEKLEKLIS
ncbi:alpha/beta hydrolase [Enterococcus sp.]|uniref:alpha/beta hydrolase n=1 Tax=Enterococcus sp. TaxID=35783 RepID=UPI0028AC7C7F|nr:alpha/beta hydrolase [Enterococcus sp.]